MLVIAGSARTQRDLLAGEACFERIEVVELDRDGRLGGSTAGPTLPARERVAPVSSRTAKRLIDRAVVAVGERPGSCAGP